MNYKIVPSKFSKLSFVANEEAMVFAFCFKEYYPQKFEEIFGYLKEVGVSEIQEFDGDTNQFEFVLKINEHHFYSSDVKELLEFLEHQLIVCKEDGIDVSFIQLQKQTQGETHNEISNL